MRSFISELRRRNVIRAAAFYAAVAWLLVQVATQVFPFFNVPNWAVRWIVIAAVIGFPLWVAFAWLYEFTPDGLKRESDLDPDEPVTRRSGRKLDRWIVALMALAIVLLLTDRFVLHKDERAVAGVPDQSIAVLPMVNESGDREQQYFSDGLSEDLITALSRFSGLKVIGRNSSFQFRDSHDDSSTIGAKLGVTHLLEGSVRRAGDAVRISAELINAADGRTLWSERYDRPYKDLFALQDDITNAVASALRTTLLAGENAAAQSDRPPGANLEAYNAYLQAKFYLARNTEADMRLAITQYIEATRIDPRYALAWAQLSHAWTDLAVQFLDGASVQQAHAQARVAADTALALNPNLAAAHVAHGFLLNADFDWIGAQAEYRRALQLAPDDMDAAFQYGTLLATLGQLDQAVALTRRALVTDPLNARWYNWLAIYLAPLGRLDEAEQAIRKAIALQPAAVGYREQLAIIAIQRGDAGVALAVAQKEPPGVWRDQAVALARQIGGDPRAADAALKSLIDRNADLAAYQIAEVYALRGDADKVFEWLERARVNRDPGIQLLLADAFLLRYKDDPRFAAFCTEVGLPLPDSASAAASQPSFSSAR